MHIRKAQSPIFAFSLAEAMTVFMDSYHPFSLWKTVGAYRIRPHLGEHAPSIEAGIFAADIHSRSREGRMRYAPTYLRLNH